MLYCTNELNKLVVIVHSEVIESILDRVQWKEENEQYGFWYNCVPSRFVSGCLSVITVLLYNYQI